MLLKLYEKTYNWLSKHIVSISILMVIMTIFLLWYMPVFFGFSAIFVFLILLLAVFNPGHIKKSLTRCMIFYFIIGLFASPVIISLGMETYKFNNPEMIFDLYHPKVIEMTEEFRTIYGSNENDAEKLLSNLKTYVYSEIPYEVGHVYVFPTMEDVFQGENADCRARAVLGFSILKNMGYDAYIAYGFVDGPHAWIKIKEEDGTYIEGFKARDNKPNYEPMIVFNEDKSTWSNPIVQLTGIFSQGFYNPTSSDLVTPLALIFLFPVSAFAIFLLFSYKVKNIMIYLFTICFCFLIPYSAGFILYENQTLNFLPIVFMCGIYLRSLNLILLEQSRYFIDIRLFWSRVSIRMHHL